MNKMKNKPRISAALVAGLILVLCSAAAIAMDGSSHVAGALLGGSGQTHITGMKQLGNQNVVVCGWTTSNVLNAKATGAQRINAGGTDAFVAIISPMLDSVLYLTFIGGLQDDKATCMDVDSRGRILVVGETSSPGFPITNGAFRQTFSNDVDGFVVWFSADLGTIERSTFLPGNRSECPKAVAIDDWGHVFICGSTTSTTDFPTNSGYRRTPIGGKDAFVIKIDSSLSIVQVGTYFGSENNDAFEDISISANGTVACVGWTESVTFEIFPKVNPWTWWVTQDRPYDWTYNGGVTDAVLTMFSEDGARLIVSTFLGGSGADTATVVEFDDADRPVVFGQSTSPDFSSTGGLVYRGGTDVFVSVLGNEGRVLRSSFMFGGGGNDCIVSASRAEFGSWIFSGTSTSWDLEAVGQGSNGIRTGIPSGMLGACTTSDIRFLTFVSGGGADHLVAAHPTSSGDVLFSGYSTSPVVPIQSDPPLKRLGETSGFVGRWAFGNLRSSMPQENIRLCIPDSVLFLWNAEGVKSSDFFIVERSTRQNKWIPVDTVLRTSLNWVPIISDTLDSPMSFRVRTNRGHALRLGGSVLLDPPLVVHELPASVAGCAGQKLTVPLRIDGRLAGLEWFLNGRKIELTSTPLVIDALLPDAVGIYQCVATAACGRVQSSSPIRVEIIRPPSITREPGDVMAVVGGEATFRVEASNTAQYSWHKVGAAGVLGTRAELRLSNLALSDAGDYYCVLQGACDSVNTRLVSLTVDNQTSVLEVSQEIDPEEQIFTIRGERLHVEPQMLPRGVYLFCRTDGFGRVKCEKRLVVR